MTAGTVTALIVFLQLGSSGGASAVQLFNDRPACEAVLADLRRQQSFGNRVIGGCYALDGVK